VIGYPSTADFIDVLQGPPKLVTDLLACFDESVGSIHLSFLLSVQLAVVPLLDFVRGYSWFTSSEGSTLKASAIFRIVEKRGSTSLVSITRVVVQGVVNYVSRAPVEATVSFSGAATLDSACTEAIE